MAERPEEQLFNVLRTAFSTEDLRTLSFLLGVDDDSLKQDNRDVLARELIRHMRNTGRLDELVERARRERPHITWPGAPARPPEVPTLVVDPLYRGDYPTIGEAVAAAQPGYLIKIRPGYYNESIVIDKPLEIVGDGPVERILIRAGGSNVIRMATANAIARNLTLRQASGDRYAVDIAEGHLVLEECDISSEGSSCVGIGNGAMATVRHNRIHDGKGAGIHVYDGGQGVIEGNDIAGTAQPGIAIATGGNLTVRQNRIHDCSGGGIHIYNGGLGVIEDNDIAGNVKPGISIGTGGNPTVRRNRVRDGRGIGIYVYGEGRGIIEDNDIAGNGHAGIVIKTGGNPTVRQNRIHRNGYKAIQVYDKGAGTFGDNDLRDNARGSWDIDESSQPLVKRLEDLE